MVQRSFSNPLLMIRPFSTARRRKGVDNDKAGHEKDSDHARKVSIDHTVSTADGSRHNASQDFSSSFDVDGSVGPYFAPEIFSVEEHGANVENVALGMKASYSEPSFLTHNTEGNSPCPCQDCSPLTMAQSQQLCYNTAFYPVGMPLQPQPSRSVQQPSPKSMDPALQARIEAIRIQQQLLGENHPDVIFALSNLAKLHQRRGNYAEAAAILRESQMRSMQAKSAPQFSTAKRQNSEDSNGVPNEISFPH